jgi:hypothetical protein
MSILSNAQSEQLISNEIHLAFGKICHAYGSILGGHSISGVNNDSHLRWLALAAIDLATAVESSTDNT